VEETVSFHTNSNGNWLFLFFIARFCEAYFPTAYERTWCLRWQKAVRVAMEPPLVLSVINNGGLLKIRFIRYHASMKIQIINSLVFNRRFLASAYEESPVDFR